jgi:hypothetical protein
MTTLADDLVPDELWALVALLLPAPPRTLAGHFCCGRPATPSRFRAPADALPRPVSPRRAWCLREPVAGAAATGGMSQRWARPSRTVRRPRS